MKLFLASIFDKILISQEYSNSSKKKVAYNL